MFSGRTVAARNANNNRKENRMNITHDQLIGASMILVPLVLAGMTPGGELLAPLAVVQFGGILGATLLNLVVMPAAAKLVIRSGREA